MSNYIPVEGQDGFYRDTKTGAIVNRNHFEYQSYIKQRQKLNSDKERIDKLENDVGDIKSMLNNIVDLLQDHK